MKKKKISFSFILPGLLLSSLSIRWNSISFLSLALSMNRSQSFYMDVMDGVSSLAERVCGVLCQPGVP